jgi:hypothetical protein
MEIQKKIVWLASYPKSGNTWFRAFLTALLNDGYLDINQIKTDGIFSSRQIFDEFTDIDSTYLYNHEVKKLQANICSYRANFYEKECLFIKIHDAYGYQELNLPIIPTESTLCAIYFIRNPLDIACSLASHINGTVDEAIALMNNHKKINTSSDNINTQDQLKQRLLSWSEHVESWAITKLPFPVLILRYEDMLTNSIACFIKALNFLGIKATHNQIETATRATRFEELKKKEIQKGFKERTSLKNLFFRKGNAGNWHTELTTLQIELIKKNHSNVMQLFNYLD